MELEVPVSEHVSADAEEVDLEGAGADWVEDSLEGAGAGLEEAGACFDIVDWEETGLETDGACLGAGAGLEETELDGADFEADFEADSTDFDRIQLTKKPFYWDLMEELEKKREELLA